MSIMEKLARLGRLSCPVGRLSNGFPDLYSPVGEYDRLGIS
jgi:hypothetical protein